MIEIAPENARDYLLARGLVPAEAQAVSEPLGGGISNLVVQVSLPGDCFVFKQSLPKLRVKDDWPFDQARIFIERDCMALLADLLPPGSVPRVRFWDDENFIFGMSCAPPGGILWLLLILARQFRGGAQASRARYHAPGALDCRGAAGRRGPVVRPADRRSGRGGESPAHSVGGPA